MKENGPHKELLRRYRSVRGRLEEAEETLRAIQNHEVDALVVKGAEGQQVFTLQGAEHPYRVLVEAMSEGAVTITPDGTILYCNAQLAELLKAPLNRLIGASFYDFIVSQDHEQSFKEMLVSCGKKGCRGEFLVKEPEGREVPVLLSARSLMLNDVDAFCIVATDLSEQRRLEEQLRQAQKMEAIGTLAGGIAHDFNNVLAAIIGFTEMVIDDVPDDPRVREKMERVLKAGLRGRDLVKQILAFTRKSEGGGKEISLTPLVKETYDLLRASLASTIRMKLAITTGDDYVVADPSQLQQVLMNLATNAADAMQEEGGQLTIELSSVTFPPGSVPPDADMKPGSYVKLAVKDTGAGITDAVRQRMFEPFFTTKGIGKGTGMGLAVVYGLVKGHGGAVTVQSEAGQGSTFNVFLPQVERPEANKDEIITRLPTGTERILFVDDEEPLVEMAQSVLERLGYHVTVAQRGSEAWNLFLEEPSRFDLIITDQTMPDVTGITLAQKMLKVRGELPIILCTGYSETVSAETAQEAGICAFVMKPLMRQELAETVRRVLDSSKAKG